MLVTFSSDAYENITMFGDVAIQLLKMMGHSATIPGAIVAADIPEALTRLQQGLAKTEKKEQNTDEGADDEEPDISLAHRAFPLLNMLKSAQKKQCDVLWA
ncbi:TPA: DUF1840 domain-containing protein [Legionella feeleii]|uniref:Domain of uncharacterized function (DUF1840) n=1 Tax=Legionella feeleii TaxID=453 RepID=A0A0W0TUU9_9GAMM|nr:DUF1840 domain-containing protein [Legionella feeleii]KTC99254.1 hypothetical protein Lfee_1420 [Legionella feeleii]SPX62683.1 Domain of uncharacterised function (DUF1840) [Legionella feeleii]STX39082.1 Domain of uncharacterised function (DUF1840) [Legionella feeleii]